MSPDIETLCKKPIGAAVLVPTITQIVSTTIVEQEYAIQDSQTVTFKPKNFILIPPFLLKPIQDLISKSNGYSRVVLVKCVKAVKDFYTKHVKDAEYADKAKSKCKEIMFWLYLASQNNNEIDAIQVTGCNNEKVASELKKIKKLCLAPTPEVVNEISTQV